MLSPYRVIDLCDDRGLLCSQILGDLGADVIQVEPPGGSPARRIGPWLKGEPGIESSLFWWAYARGKRSVVLDLEDENDLGVLVAVPAKPAHASERRHDTLVARTSKQAPRLPACREVRPPRQ